MTDLKETSRENEPKPVKYRVIFEPGDHLSSDEEWKTHLEKIENGSLFEANTWLNGDIIVGRMKDYEPKYVVPDGFLPSVYGQLEHKKNAWTHLPGIPSDISPSTSTVYVVAGDLAMDLTNISSDSDYNKDFHDRSKSVFKSGWETNILGRNVPTSLVENIPLAFTGSGAAFMISVAGLAVTARAMQRDESGISRRQFLAMAGAFGVTFGIAGLGAGRWVGSSSRPDSRAAFSPTKIEKDYWLKVANLTQPAISTWDEVDARTAIAVLKSRDAMVRNNENDDVVASVLMGYGHSRRAVKMMGDVSYSNRIIGIYFRKLKEVVNKLDLPKPLEDTLSQEDFRRQMIGEIYSYVARTDVFLVRDPLRNKNGTIPSNNEVLESVFLVDSFDSPSIKKVWDKNV